MSDVTLIVGAAVSLVSVCGLLIKFTVSAVFQSLQNQITKLSEAAEERDKEIVVLRKLIDTWQEKYYLLSVDHSKLQAKHEALQNEFERMKAQKNGTR